MDLAYLTDLITYWRDEYEWREQERRLNAFDHYKTRIDDLDIHFIHQRSPEPDALPIIITHGWPGSIAEFTKIIGPLSDPVAHGGNADDAFHVVAASMPGYGFSDKPHRPGFGLEQIAEVNARLMARLGYERYGIQGGDWGSIVSRWHAFNHPDNAVGLHINMVVAGPPRGVDDPNAGVPPEELARSRERQAFYNTDENGYARIQGTKPQTLGYALNDSPAGQAAWIVEKFRAWCDCDGDPETIFTKDELLTNVMLYWVNETATSSARLYYESGRAPTSRPMGRVEVPTGAAIFPKELFIAPRKWVEAGVQPGPLDRDAPWRSLRCHGAAGAAGRGPPDVLRGSPVAKMSAETPAPAPTAGRPSRVPGIGLGTAVVSLLLLPTAALGYRSGLVPLTTAFALLAGGTLAGAVGALVSGVGVVGSSRRGWRRGVTVGASGLAIGVVTVGLPALQIVAARGLPAIHDVTTDTADRPGSWPSCRCVRMRPTRPTTTSPSQPRNETRIRICDRR